MASLIKVGQLSKICLKNPAVTFTAVRNRKLYLLLLIYSTCESPCHNIQLRLCNIVLYVDWNKDFKPGPYPQTAEEKAAAAKKYGLTPTEYEPYPDDGMGHGDYPKLPLISTDQKDPYYPYDFPELKRNFNEPVCNMVQCVD